MKYNSVLLLRLNMEGKCRQKYRSKHREALAREVNVETAILDCELGVPDHLGRTVFAAMMKRRHEARYFGFDLLSLNGEDLRCSLGRNAYVKYFQFGLLMSCLWTTRADLAISCIAWRANSTLKESWRSELTAPIRSMHFLLTGLRSRI